MKHKLFNLISSRSTVFTSQLFYSFFVCLLLASCHKKKDDPMPPPTTSNFKVTIENVFMSKTFFASGIFNTPVGTSSPGPITGGNSFTFSFDAPKGSKLSFAAMFGQSNDVFYAPAPSGISLYNGSTPVSGDVTSQIYMWDAGTEVNQEPGVGADQAPRESAPNTGTSESNPVMKITNVNDGFTYPSVSSVLKVSISNSGSTHFVVTFENISNGTTLSTSQGGKPAPVSPGVWVIHTTDAPIFQENQLDMGQGLEHLAEDGNPTSLGTSLASNAGYFSPIAPGAWAVHSAMSMPIFTYNMNDYGKGLEHLAEDGVPTTLLSSLPNVTGVKSSGVYNTGVGSSSAGPILPGQKFEFTITASQGDHLSFASMLGQSNDEFFAFDDTGISLFKDDGSKMTGDVTSMVSIWDAGTEVNEYPGAGPNQAPRQSAPNTGPSESSPVVKVKNKGDGFTWPDANKGIKVTITPL